MHGQGEPGAWNPSLQAQATWPVDTQEGIPVLHRACSRNHSTHTEHGENETRKEHNLHAENVVGIKPITLDVWATVRPRKTLHIKYLSVYQ